MSIVPEAFVEHFRILGSLLYILGGLVLVIV